MLSPWEEDWYQALTAEVFPLGKNGLRESLDSCSVPQPEREAKCHLADID
jgi:hypothetical protein